MKTRKKLILLLCALVLVTGGYFCIRRPEGKAPLRESAGVFDLTDRTLDDMRGKDTDVYTAGRAVEGRGRFRRIRGHSGGGSTGGTAGEPAGDAPDRERRQPGGVRTDEPGGRRDGRVEKRQHGLQHGRADAVRGRVLPEPVRQR